MELTYSNKKPAKEILDKAYNIGINLTFESKKLLIKGDNFQSLSVLLKSFKNSIDLVYIDPPFNTNQVFKIQNDRVSTISRGLDGEVAYSDDLKLDEYLEFMRERLIILRELLSDIGSIYVHIDIKVGHYLKLILDEVFGKKNFLNEITRVKSNPKNFARKAYGNEKDVIYFYAKNKGKHIWNDIKKPIDNDQLVKLFPKLDKYGNRYTTIPLHAPGQSKNGVTSKPWRGKLPPTGRHWRTDPEKFDKLDELGLIEWSKNGNPRIIRYAKEHSGSKIQDIWIFKDPQNPIYPTEKNEKMLELIINQSSKKNSIVLDSFCGSGSTLFSAEKLTRNWIGLDQSSYAISTSKEKLRNAIFDYIDLGTKQ